MNPDNANPSHTITEKHRRELQKAFAMFDKDGSGLIDATELLGCLKAMGMHPTPYELDELLKKMDTDGNGQIDFDEFVAVMGDEFEDQEMEKELREMKSLFTMLDKDGNGRLSAEELQGALKILGVRLTDEEALHIMNEVDKDHTGDVSFDEFAAYVVNFDDTKYEDLYRYHKHNKERRKL